MLKLANVATPLTALTGPPPASVPLPVLESIRLSSCGAELPFATLTRTCPGATVSAAVEGGLLISLSSLQAVRRTASTDAATPIAHRLVTGRLRDLWTPRGGSTKFEWTRSSVCKARTDQRSSTAPAYDVASSPHERASAIKPSRRTGDLCHAAAGYGSSVTLNGALVAPLTAGPLATSV